MTLFYIKSSDLLNCREKLLAMLLIHNTIEKCVPIKFPNKPTYTFHRCKFCEVNTHNSCTGGSAGGAETYLAH